MKGLRDASGEAKCVGIRLFIELLFPPLSLLFLCCRLPCIFGCFWPSCLMFESCFYDGLW